MMDGIRFSELLDYTERESRRWKEWFEKNPAAFDLPVDIAGTGSVKRLVKHICYVELFFANQILGLPTADFEAIPSGSVAEVFKVSEEAAGKYRQFLASAKPEDWTSTISLKRAGLNPTKRKAIVQAMTHSLRHWAQLATFLRQQGYTTDWVHDFLMSDAME